MHTADEKQRRTRQLRHDACRAFLRGNQRDARRDCSGVHVVRPAAPFGHVRDHLGVGGVHPDDGAHGRTERCQHQRQAARVGQGARSTVQDENVPTSSPCPPSVSKAPPHSSAYCIADDGRRHGKPAAHALRYHRVAPVVSAEASAHANPRHPRASCRLAPEGEPAREWRLAAAGATGDDDGDRVSPCARTRGHSHDSQRFRCRHRGDRGIHPHEQRAQERRAQATRLAGALKEASPRDAVATWRDKTELSTAPRISARAGGAERKRMSRMRAHPRRSLRVVPFWASQPQLDPGTHAAAPFLVAEMSASSGAGSAGTFTAQVVQVLRNTANTNNARRLANAIDLDGKLHAARLSEPELRHLASSTGALAGVDAVAAQVANMAAPKGSATVVVEALRGHARDVIRSVKAQAAAALQALGGSAGNGSDSTRPDEYESNENKGAREAREAQQAQHQSPTGSHLHSPAAPSVPTGRGRGHAGAKPARPAARVNVGALVGAIIAAVLAVAVIIGLAVALPAHMRRVSKAKNGAKHLAAAGEPSLAPAAGSTARSASAAAAAGRR